MTNEKPMCEREHAINSIAKSIASIEESLSDILCAESKKIKAVLPTPDYDEYYTDSEYTEKTCDEDKHESCDEDKHEPCDNLCCYLAVNKSVKDMVKSITMLEIVLADKLDLISNCLCPDNLDDVCKKRHK